MFPPCPLCCSCESCHFSLWHSAPEPSARPRRPLCAIPSCKGKHRRYFNLDNLFRTRHFEHFTNCEVRMFICIHVHVKGLKKAGAYVAWDDKSASESQAVSSVTVPCTCMVRSHPGPPLWQHKAGLREAPRPHHGMASDLATSDG